MVEIRLQIDEKCELCKESTEKMVLYRGNLYPTRMIRGQIMVVRPDLNAGGITTHYHIEFEKDPLVKS